MRFRTSAAVALSVATAGLCAAGCSSSSSSGSSGGSASGTAAATTAASQAGAVSAPAASQAAGTGSGSGTKCQPSDLRVSLGAKGTYEGSSDLQAVDLTNASSATCTMDGFAGVNLVGTVNGKSGYQWPLERSTVASPANVPLAPGGTAHFNIAYLPWGHGTAGQEINVYKVIITPPDDYAQASVTWNQGILLQDAATHPGTWIQPVRSGA
ncbi:MAG TPA: DUF4232 domain-containing protein [Trebonia sp.]